MAELSLTINAALVPEVRAEFARLQGELAEAREDFELQERVARQLRDVVETLCRATRPKCAHCGGPASCVGSYERADAVGFACNDCCGHGCEDGWCVIIEGERADDMSQERWLEGLAKECRSCPCCQEVPCGGCQAGGVCDAFTCKREDDVLDDGGDFEGLNYAEDETEDADG